VIVALQVLLDHSGFVLILMSALRIPAAVIFSQLVPIRRDVSIAVLVQMVTLEVVQRVVLILTNVCFLNAID
jgi:hypothetical protein